MMINQSSFCVRIIGLYLSLFPLNILAQSSNELPELIDAQLSLIKTEFKQGDFDPAFQILNELDDEIAENYPDSLLRRGVFLKNFSDFLYDNQGEAPGLSDSTINFYKRAIPFLEQAESIELLSQCYLGISSTYIQHGKLKPAEKYLKEVEKIKDLLPENAASIYMQSLSLLGFIYQLIGDYDQAFEKYMQVLKEESNLPTTNSLDSAYNLNNVGAMFSTFGDFGKGSEYKLQALEIYNRIDEITPDDLSTIYLNIGYDQSKLNQTDRAIETLQKALIYAERAENRDKGKELFISIYNELASIYMQKEEPEIVISFLLEALKHGDDYQNVSTINSLGNVYKTKKEYDRAAIYLNQALSIYKEKLGDKHPILARQLLLLGQIHLSKGETEAAINEFQKALTMLSNDFESRDWKFNPTLSGISDRSYLLYVFQEKIKGLRALRKDKATLELALQTTTLAINLTDTLALSFESKSALNLLNQRARVVYELGIATALDLYEITGNETLLETAFIWSEKSKSALLTSSLRQNDALQFAGIPDTLQAYEARLKRQRTFYQTKIITEERSGDAKDQSKISLWQNKLFNFNREYEALKKDIEKKYPDYYQLSYDLSVASVNDIQENLKEEQVLTEYFMGDKEWFVFGITKNEILVKRGEIGNLNQEIDKLSNLLSTENSDITNYQNIAFSLYQTLLKPVDKLIDDKKLIFIPDGLLNKISFEALLIEEKETDSWNSLPYLIKTHETSYGYSATLWLQSKGWRKQVKFRKQIPRKKQFLGYEPFKHLPNTFTEIEQINKIVQGKVRAWPNPLANKNTFLSEAPNFGILHLATHAVIDNEEPLNSRLVFSPEEISNQDLVNDQDLYAWELYNLRLKAQMVVLSACNTGTGKLEKAEGVISLGRAFVYAGVPSIVMSLWLAESQSTAEIMTDFYQNLEAGKSKSAALRKAKLKHLNSDVFDTHHPYFWATFVVLGDSESLRSENLMPRELWIALLIILILCGGAAKKILRKRTDKE